MRIDEEQRPPARKRVAIIKPCYPHLATIGRQPYETIADMTLLSDHPRGPHASAVTLRTLLSSPALEFQRVIVLG
jgi:hypothetical protein